MASGAAPDERPIRPAGERVLRAFAGLNPVAGYHEMDADDWEIIRQVASTRGYSEIHVENAR